MKDNYLEHIVKEGDTLQLLANDLMNDVGRWQEIAFVNGLKYPYISDDDVYRLDPAVRKTGEALVIPVTVNQEDLLPRSEIAELYRSALGADLDVIGTDETRVDLTSEEIVEFRGDGQDLKTTIGGDNLKQSLILRLATPYGTLLGHPTYGSRLGELIGTQGTSENLQRIRVEVERTILTDRRVKEVEEVDARIENDAVILKLNLTPQDLNILINLDLSITEGGEISWA